MATRVLTACFLGDLHHLSVTDFSEPAHESSYSVLTPLGKRGDYQDAEDSPFAALVTSWLTSLAAAAPLPYSRMGGVSLPGRGRPPLQTPSSMN